MPFIAGAERARQGKLAIRATLDCSGESYEEYAEWHIADSAHIHCYKFRNFLWNVAGTETNFLIIGNHNLHVTFRTVSGLLHVL